MSRLSIIMPCYNAAPYLSKAIAAIQAQIFTDWELIVVDDGSTDDSATIARVFSETDHRIKVVSKTNGGYVSARLYGLQHSADSGYIIFCDADDAMHPEMFQRLVALLEADPQAGAAYCNHLIMDEKDVLTEKGIDMPRYIPTAFWCKSLPESFIRTPFVSIFCWTKMIEPMTMMRRQAYYETPGWDIDFGLGQGNIGEGVFLFSEMALKWKVYYEPMPLYYYRRHSVQMSAVPAGVMKRQRDIVLLKWHHRIKELPSFSKMIKAATVFLKYRLEARQCAGSFKHELRYHPFRFCVTFIRFLYFYICSIPLIWEGRRLTKEIQL